MASWIVLDWDQDQFHIVVAQSGRRGAQVTRALTWAHPEPFTPSTADRVGKALRAFLDSAKIAAAPVIVGVGRDRVFLKELRFPALEAHEEASLVRFQTAKELTESIESYAVDYMHLGGSPGGEREIMTVAGRRDIVGMAQTLCQAAGLKLHAVTPRVFGLGYAVSRAVQPDPNPLQPNQLNAVLTIGQRWAELCFFRGDRLLQAQALANGPLLVSEIKRNLAVFQSQHAVNVDLAGPNCLYVFGKGGSVVEALEAGQALPIRLLDPLKPEPAISADLANPGNFAGAVGLAATFQGADVPSAPMQRNTLLGAVAALCGIAMIGYCLLSGFPRGSFSAVKTAVFMTGLALSGAGLYLLGSALLKARSAGGWLSAAGKSERPVNLATPRRHSAPVSAGKQRGMLWGVGAGVALLLFVAMLWGGLSYQRSRLTRLVAERNALEKQLNDVRQERAEIEAYKDWDQSTIRWLDELYDLSARYPYQPGFRVQNLKLEASGNKKSGKDAFIGKITVSGIMPLGKDDYVRQLTQNMSGDPHLRPQVDRFAKQVYDMKIEVAHQDAKDYKTNLIKPKRPIVEAAPVEEKKKEDPSAEDDDQ